MSNTPLRTSVRRFLPLLLISAAAAACGGAADDGAAKEDGTGSTESALSPADRKVCWSPLQVRTGPAMGSIGQTYRGRTFHISRYSPSGAWAEGYALSCDGYYASGWVQVAGLADSNGNCADGPATFRGCF